MTRRSSRSLLALGWAIAAACVLAACGSGGSSAPNTSVTRTQTARSNGVARESPKQIIAAAQAAMRPVHAFVAVGTFTRPGQASQFVLVIGGSSKLDLRLRSGSKDEHVIVLGGTSYVRASKAYWKGHVSAAQLGLVANRWIEFPTSANKSMTSGLGPLDPRTFARCLGENLGTLSLDGTTTVNGKPAVVIRDAGDVPGGSPGTIAVASTGKPYPLRLTATGPTRPGGKVDACNDGKASSMLGTMTLSHFNHPPAITAPAAAVRIPSSTSSV